MPTVFELSEPYLNHLVPVLPAGTGVCAVCWRAIEAKHRLCYACNAAQEAFGAQLADIVIPIALSVKHEQLAHELWHYKYDTDASVRARLGIRLAAVLWRFLALHEAHVADAVNVPGFDIVTTVPGTRPRTDEHPLVTIVRRIGQTRDRYEPAAHPRTRRIDRGSRRTSDRYQPTRTLAEHPSVLLVDDTWTTGGRAQSAAIALREAGAAQVAVVVIGRHFDRAFGTGEAYYQRARSLKFTWDRCCLENVDEAKRPS